MKYPFWPEGPVSSWGPRDWSLVAAVYLAGLVAAILVFFVFGTFPIPPAVVPE
jgi:hypothetical protein